MENCPLKGKCLTESIIYKARISTNNGTSTYIGRGREGDTTMYWKKEIVLFRDQENPLNKRSELMGKCRHRAKYLLSTIMKLPNHKLPTGQG